MNGRRSRLTVLFKRVLLGAYLAAKIFLLPSGLAQAQGLTSLKGVTRPGGSSGDVQYNSSGHFEGMTGAALSCDDGEGVNAPVYERGVLTGGSCAAAGGAAAWLHEGSTTYLANDGDNVGIGTSDPQAKLDVVGGAQADDLDLTGTLSVDGLADFTGSDGGAQLSFRSSHRGLIEDLRLWGDEDGLHFRGKDFCEDCQIQVTETYGVSIGTSNDVGNTPSITVGVQNNPATGDLILGRENQVSSTHGSVVGSRNQSSEINSFYVGNDLGGCNNNTLCLGMSASHMMKIADDGSGSFDGTFQATDLEGGTVSAGGGGNTLYYCDGGASAGNMCRGNGCSCSGGTWVATSLKVD